MPIDKPHSGRDSSMIEEHKNVGQQCGNTLAPVQHNGGVEQLKDSTRPNDSGQPKEVEFLDPDGYVYVLKAGDYYKIGRSKNATRRLRQLKIQLPFPVEVYCIFPCENHVAAEKLAHDTFPDLRANGEWFLIEDEPQIYWMREILFARQGKFGIPEWICRGCAA